MNEKNNAFPPKNHSIFIKEGGGMVGGLMVFRGDGRGDRSNTTEPYGGSGKFYCYNQILWPPPPSSP